MGRNRVAFKMATLAVLVAWTMLPASVSQAHATLTRSDPETGSVLPQSPQIVTLEFSESLEAGFSQARLVDAGFQVISEGSLLFDPANPRVIHLEPPALPEGAYSVLWQVRSAVDGHTTNGSVSFAIGMAVPQASRLPPAGIPGPAQAAPALAESLLRWLAYLAASLAAGSVVFGIFVWKPAYQDSESPSEASDERTARILGKLILTGSAGLVIANLLFLLYQAWQSSQGIFQLPFGTAFLQLLAARSGWLFLFRFVFLGILALLARRLPGPGVGPARPWGAAFILACAVLLTISLESHSAALGLPLAVAADWVHLLAMTAWLGGLFPLFLVLRRSELPASLLVPRFTRLALACITALGLTGLYSATLHVGSLRALSSTTYGQALSTKTVLFLLLAGLGAVNFLVLTPRLPGFTGRAVGWLQRTVRVELVLALLALLAAGVLMGAAPAQEALQAERRLGYVGDYRENGVKMRLWVAPGIAGDNELAVDVSGLPDGPDSAQAAVLLRLRMADHEMGITQVETKPGEHGRFSARGSYLSMAGNWEIEMILRQPGQNDIRHSFMIQVGRDPQESTLPNPVPADSGSIATGQALYEQYCLTCHGPRGKGDGPAGLAMNPQPADLSAHAVPGVHPDGQLFEWISNGYPGSAMPAFRDILTEEQRWHLVNFIRTLAP